MFALEMVGAGWWRSELQAPLHAGGTARSNGQDKAFFDIESLTPLKVDPFEIEPRLIAA
jgi:hypothetical protein